MALDFFAGCVGGKFALLVFFEVHEQNGENTLNFFTITKIFPSKNIMCCSLTSAHPDSDNVKFIARISPRELHRYVVVGSKNFAFTV